MIILKNMELIISTEKSGVPESRDSAKSFLEIFKHARKNGEPKRMTGRELRLYNLEHEVRKTDKVRADQIHETRMRERADKQRELEAYWADLNAKIAKMKR